MTIGGFATAYDWSLAGGMMVFVTTALAIWSFGAAMASFREMPRAEALGQAVLWPALLAVIVAVGVLQLAETPSENEYPVLVAALVLFGVAIALTAIAFLRKGVTLVDALAVAAIGAGAIAFALFVPDVELWQRVLGGAIVIVAALWAVSLGQSGRHPAGKVLGLVAFGAEIIYLYVRTFGTLLDTAIAFLLGGLLFVILAFVLFRTERMLARRVTAPPAIVSVSPAPEPPVATVGSQP